MNKIKFLLLVWGLCLVGINEIQAQAEPVFPSVLNFDTTYLKDPIAFLSELDSVKINANFLIDRTIYTDEILNINGVTNVESINYYIWSKTYTYLKYTHKDTALLPSQNILENARQSKLLLENVTVLSAFNVKFKKIKEEAYNNGEFVIVNGKLDDTGATDSSYSSHRAVGISVLGENISGSKINFEIPEYLYFSDSNSALMSLEIDFGDGTGYQPINLNEIRSVNYSGEGGYIEIKMKLIVEDINTSDQSTYYAHASVYRKNTDHIPAVSSSEPGARKKGDDNSFTEYYPTDEPLKIIVGQLNGAEAILNPQNTIEATFFNSP